MKTKILAEFQICISVPLRNSHFILTRANEIFQIVSFKSMFGFCFFYLSCVSINLILILHLEFKILFSHFAYIGTHDTFQVSSWKSVSLFRLSKLNEDEVCGSADSIGRFLSTFRSYFPIWDLSPRIYKGAWDI